MIDFQGCDLHINTIEERKLGDVAAYGKGVLFKSGECNKNNNKNILNFNQWKVRY